MRAYRWLSRFGICLAVISSVTISVAANPFRLVSVADPSLEPSAGGNGDSWSPIMTPDGRYVLFASSANNLCLTSNNTPLPDSMPRWINVYLRDRAKGTTTLVSANPTGTAGGNDNSIPVDISTNGRYALFESSAGDLVLDDTNKAADVFVRDLVNGMTMIVSVNTNGGVANGDSYSAVMTPDGRYVAFVSAASDLVADDTNGIPDVFVRDLQSGVTVLASVGAKEAHGMIFPSSSASPDITPDGRFVAFYSTASNLVAGVKTVGDVYVRDLSAGMTYWASQGARSNLPPAISLSTTPVCYNQAISADGKFVVYQASTNGLPAGTVFRFSLETGHSDVVTTIISSIGGPDDDINNLAITSDGRYVTFVGHGTGDAATGQCVYVWDASTGIATLASGGPNGQVAPTYSTCDWPNLDATGRYLTFLSSATNLVTNTLVGDYHLYRRDLQTGATTLLDIDTNGVGCSVGPESIPSMSADGRFAAFVTAEATLVANDRNKAADVFVRDLTTGMNEMISVHDPALGSVTPNGISAVTAFGVSADGRYVAFTSEADNVTANDANSLRDVFVRDRESGPSFLVSVATNGFSGNGMSTEPAISGDGRYVAFTSSSDNLVANDTNRNSDVFVRDMQEGKTTLVSIAADGPTSGRNGASYSPTISADGRYVLFISQATSLTVPPLPRSVENVYYRDRQLGKTYALSTNFVTRGASAAMTPSGRFVAFVISGSSSRGSLYVWDSQAAALIDTGTVSDQSANKAISPDGRWVIYSLTTGSQLAAVDVQSKTNIALTLDIAASQAGLRFSADSRFLVYSTFVKSQKQVYLYDFLNHRSLLVSRSYLTGQAANGGSDAPDISADGRFVAYRSDAPDLVPNDNNVVPDVFLYDQATDTTTVMSRSRFGNFPANDRSLSPVFSGDGRTLVFASWASDIVPQDFNLYCDLFAFTFLNVSIAADTVPSQGFQLSWPFVPGNNYRVQFKNSLADPGWQDLSGSVSNVANKAYFKDPASATDQRFYRIGAD